MKRKISIALFLLTALTVLFISCAKKETLPSQNRFPPETSFHIGIETSKIKTRVSFFFDKEGAFHLLHEDPTSPLLGMEEIFTEDSVRSHFYEMEFVNIPYSGGVGIVYCVLNAIQETSPSEIAREKDSIVYEYHSDLLSFRFICARDTKSPLKITGKAVGEAFNINFTSAA